MALWAANMKSKTPVATVAAPHLQFDTSEAERLTVFVRSMWCPDMQTESRSREKRDLYGTYRRLDRR